MIFVCAPTRPSLSIVLVQQPMKEGPSHVSTLDAPWTSTVSLGQTHAALVRRGLVALESCVNWELSKEARAYWCPPQPCGGASRQPWGKVKRPNMKYNYSDQYLPCDLTSHVITLVGNNAWCLARRRGFGCANINQVMDWQDHRSTLTIPQYQMAAKRLALAWRCLQKSQQPQQMHSTNVASGTQTCKPRAIRHLLLVHSYIEYEQLQEYLKEEETVLSSAIFRGAIKNLSWQKQNR